MTSYEFEVAAKNAVVYVLRSDEYNLDVTVADLNLVWFAHILGFKKCTIWGKPMGNKYAEVTYNRDKNEFYVDIYVKDMNIKYDGDEINTKIKRLV